MSIKKEILRQKQARKQYFRIGNAKRHAIRRLRERYYIKISLQELEELNNKIANSKSQCIGKMSLTKSAHLIEIQGKLCLAIYNNKINSIVTFVPKYEVDKIVKENEECQSLDTQMNQ